MYKEAHPFKKLFKGIRDTDNNRARHKKNCLSLGIKLYNRY